MGIKEGPIRARGLAEQTLMPLRFHVHVYHITGMTHLAVEAGSEEEARTLAFALAKHVPIGPSDCPRIAIAYPVRDGNAKLTLDKQ